MKWFSLSGIASEIKRVRWPKPKDLMKNTGSVVFFTIAFGVFFVLCDAAAYVFLQFLGF